HPPASRTQMAGGAVVGGGGKVVVRSEEASLLLVVSPAHHALFVEIDATVGDLRLSRRCQCDESPRNQGVFRPSPQQFDDMKPYALNHTPPCQRHGLLSSCVLSRH